MAMRRLTELRAKEFRSLADVTIPLGPLTVLVGPNGSGKSNVLNMLRFLAATVRFDLASAIEDWGGYEHVKRQAGQARSQVSLGVTGQITQHSSERALDIYDLHFRLTAKGALTRSETFQFKRTKGRGRRITISGDRAEFSGDDRQPEAQRLANRQTTGLATLPKLADEQGGEGIRALAEFLSSMRVLEPDVSEARTPARRVSGPLADDASNLAAALHRLSTTDEDAFRALQSEMCYCLQGLEAIEFQSVGGPGKSVAIVLRERGLRRPVELADASFGTVRLLSVLTALHEPDPPPFTAIEEIDHGLHPYAIDVLVDRMRRATRDTQLLVATHSPTLVNRLHPDELVVCGRDPDTGASLIPMTDTGSVVRAVDESQLGLGELWFAGAIGGVPELV